LVAKITSRDFKRGRQGGLRLDLGRWREFGLGLALGLSLSAFVLVWQNYREKQVAKAATEQPKPEPRAATSKDPEAAMNYEFYEKLPSFEVQVPEKAQAVANEREPAPASVDRPGVYVIQAGSFRKQEDADRVQAQLRVLGIESTVHKVPGELSDLHRVRIGPITDLAELNRLRARLRAADFDSMPMRVGD
jgi:cell division protein FtsN